MGSTKLFILKTSSLPYQFPKEKKWKWNLFLFVCFIILWFSISSSKYFSTERELPLSSLPTTQAPRRAAGSSHSDLTRATLCAEIPGALDTVINVKYFSDEEWTSNLLSIYSHGSAGRRFQAEQKPADCISIHLPLVSPASLSTLPTLIWGKCYRFFHYRWAQNTFFQLSQLTCHQ